VLAGILIGLVWKFRFFSTADQVYAAIPLHDGFFPDWLQISGTLRIAYLTTLACVLIAWIAEAPGVRKIALTLGQLSATVMLLHQGSYNDMTFTTVWWANLWSVWFAFRSDRDRPEVLFRKAAWLSRVVLSLVLLGGAAGKWTAEYWSGEVLYEIYFSGRDYWIFNLLRSSFDVESVKWIAMLYSRFVVVTESIGALTLWMLPSRWAAVAGVVIFASIGILSNPLLFSVLCPLIALSIAGWFDSPRRVVAAESAAK
jgi:hypothetical protein